MVRAKFYVESITTHAPNGGKQQATISMRPVNGDSEENKQFWAYTR